MLRVTSFASECGDFAWPARTAIGGHACALELFLESTENATRNGVASIRTFSSMSVETSLKVAAVERHQRERGNVEIVKATHVDRDRICALCGPPARECADPALWAELMVNGLLAELIVLQVLQARTQRKLVRRDEHPQRAPLLADRAVAGDHAADVGCDLETDLAAVAAAGVIPALRHRDLQRRNQRRVGQPAV